MKGPKFMHNDIALREQFEPFGELERVYPVPGKLFSFLQFANKVFKFCINPSIAHGNSFFCFF